MCDELDALRGVGPHKDNSENPNKSPTWWVNCGKGSPHAWRLLVLPVQFKLLPYSTSTCLYHTCHPNIVCWSVNHDLGLAFSGSTHPSTSRRMRAVRTSGQWQQAKWCEIFKRSGVWRSGMNLLSFQHLLYWNYINRIKNAILSTSASWTGGQKYRYTCVYNSRTNN